MRGNLPLWRHKRRSAIVSSADAADNQARRGFAQPGLFFALAVFLPLITLASTFLLVRSAYTGNVFHEQGFLEQYGTGIYRYRILGRTLLLHAYHLLLRLRGGHDGSLVTPADAHATALFYLAYGVVNGIGLLLANLGLLLLVWDRREGLSDSRCVGYLFTWLVLVLSSFAVTPYDTLAYAFMTIGFLAVRIRPAWLSLAVVSVAAILGGLTRETEFLVSPALWTAAIFTAGAVRRRLAVLGFVHVGVFALCYMALRMRVPGPAAIAQVAVHNSRGGSVGLASMCAVLYIALVLFRRQFYESKAGGVFLMLSSPYLMTILWAGLWIELRLIVPIIVGLLFVYTELNREQRERLPAETSA